MACLRERVVLAQDRDRRLQSADRLEHVLLLSVELGQLLLAKRRRLVEGLLVLRDLGLPFKFVEVNHRRPKMSQREKQWKDAKEAEPGSETERKTGISLLHKLQGSSQPQFGCSHLGMRSPLGLEVLDLGVQARAARRELLDVRSERPDECNGFRHLEWQQTNEPGNSSRVLHAI